MNEIRRRRLLLIVLPEPSSLKDESTRKRMHDLRLYHGRRVDVELKFAHLISSFPECPVQFSAHCSWMCMQD